ncbi:30S ribosomal protein S16 [Enterobacteriaceae endosymbiont of Donacia tomentosa]|uniref:30S ribosomal protein S16 n=1 Tax=Enterobacteriaceae endosymbiont of Donacia tomentosa TaxID=2675787 RepID=UPI001448A8B0|nr:30S ribosomal protein S16 [Enterobacteriaceae endosymbiont of Donacia tomentosa]QJC31825.1 30S ribosomal protein S16 [Enterobacteriaceae endosymbiont of Donacia tomentosa]
MVKIRLARKGIKKKPFYHIVVTDSRNSRDGRFIERLGYFDPIFKEKTKIKINKERVNFWLAKGALISKRVNFLLK